MNERRNDLEIMNWYPQIALQIQNSDRSPLYDVRNPAGKVCKDVACEVMFRGRLFEAPCSSIASSFDFIWWSQTGSNRRPHACKARALPAELWPRTRRRMLLLGPSSPFGLCRARFTRLSTVAAPRVATGEAWWAWEDLNFRPHAYQARALTN